MSCPCKRMPRDAAQWSVAPTMRLNLPVVCLGAPAVTADSAVAPDYLGAYPQHGESARSIAGYPKIGLI